MIQILITIKDKETLENYKDVHEDLIAEDFINNSKAWFEVMDDIQITKTNIDAEKYIIKFIEKIKIQYPELIIEYEYDEKEDQYKIWHTNREIQSSNAIDFLDYCGNSLRTILYNNNIYNFSFGYDYYKDMGISE
jgi:hypothetical protein